MHHRKSGRQLNRNSSHRLSMFRNMLSSLIFSEIIKTTVPKAKELQKIIEPLITLSKKNNSVNRRLVFSQIRNNKVVTKLFNNIGPRFLNRCGGYTRILKCFSRKGDSAKLAYIELMDRKIQKKENIEK